MVWERAHRPPRGPLGRARRARDRPRCSRRPSAAWRALPRRRRPPSRGRARPRRASRGSAGSRSSSASSCRRSRSCRSAARCAAILLGAAVATTVGAIDDFRGLRWWQKLGGPGARRRDPGRVRRLGAHASRSRSSACTSCRPGSASPLTDRRDRRGDEHGQLPRRARRARRGRLRDLGALVLRDRALARPRRTRRSSTAIVFGACLGFLRHNFYPARIFMGDSGALLLGFTLAAVSVQGLLKTAALATLVLPLLVLAVPAARHVVRRREADQAAASRSTSPTARTSTTASMRIGFSQRRAVVYLYGVVRDARARGARDALRPPAPARRLGRRERRDRRRRRRCSRSASRSTSSTCSRSSSSRTRSSAAARSGAREQPSASSLRRSQQSRAIARNQAASAVTNSRCHKSWYAPAPMEPPRTARSRLPRQARC